MHSYVMTAIRRGQAAGSCLNQTNGKSRLLGHQLQKANNIAACVQADVGLNDHRSPGCMTMACRDTFKTCPYVLSLKLVINNAVCIIVYFVYRPTDSNVDTGYCWRRPSKNKAGC